MNKSANEFGMKVFIISYTCALRVFQIINPLKMA